MKIVSFLVSSFLLLPSTLASYAGRSWTQQGVLTEAATPYTRTPFVQWGRGVMYVSEGYDQDTKEMYISTHFGAGYPLSKKTTLLCDECTPMSYYNQSEDPAYYKDFDDDSKFGFWTAWGGDERMGIHLAVGTPRFFFNFTETRNDDYDDVYRYTFDNGAIYMYKGEYDMWSTYQFIWRDDYQKNEPDQFDPFQRTRARKRLFGESLWIDQKTNREMIVGARQDDSMKGFAGAAYVFRYSDESERWSVQQVLYPNDLNTQDNFGNSAIIYDEFMMIGSTLDDDYGFSSGVLYSFRQDRENTMMWSQQQKLYGFNMTRDLSFGEFPSMWFHDLIVGSPHQWAHKRESGLVNYFETTPTFKPGELEAWDRDMKAGKPRPKPIPKFYWWSLQQVLIPHNPHGNLNFGQYVAIYNNLAAVGAYGYAGDDVDWFDPQSTHYEMGKAYIFIKTNGRWSEQQELLLYDGKKSDNFGDPYLHGSNLIVRKDTQHGYVFRDNLDWHCLKVNVWDGFGDGWGEIVLQARAPPHIINTKRTDEYHPWCSSSNPLEFRYCPLHPEDAGEYLWHVPSHKTKPFWPEIGWSIENEKDGKIYYGHADTIMVFNWVEELRHFDFLPHVSHHLRPEYCECIMCSPVHDRNTSKLTVPAPSITLDSPTHYPTLTPDPTYVGVELEEFNVEMTTLNGLDGWFNRNCTGAAYYIYDITGIDLIYEGSLCEQTPDHQCFVPLDDGAYILRTTGALDLVDTNNIIWFFCGVSGGATEQLEFYIVNGKCVAPTSFTAQTYCEDRLHSFFLVSGTIQLTYGLVSIPTLTADDLKIFEKVFQESLPDIVIEKVVTYDSNQHDGVYTFYLFIDMTRSGYGRNNVEAGSLEMYEYVMTKCKELDEDGHFLEVITGTAGSEHLDTNTLVAALNVKVTGLQSLGLKSFAVTPHGISEEEGFAITPVEEVVESPAATEAKEKESFFVGMLKFESLAGYILLAVITLYVIVFVYGRRSSASSSLSEVDDDKNASEGLLQEEDTENSQPQVPAHAPVRKNSRSRKI